MTKFISSNYSGSASEAAAWTARNADKRAEEPAKAGLHLALKVGIGFIAVNILLYAFADSNTMRSVMGGL